MISDQVWAGLAQVYRGSEPAVVLAALGTGRWRCGGCGALDADADSSVVLVLHYAITYRPGGGQWDGATIDQPPDPGVWRLETWELRRYHPGCAPTGVVFDATATSPSRRAGDPPPRYPQAPEPPATRYVFWWTRSPAGVPVMIWQPEVAQPIVSASRDVYPVCDAHVRRVAQLGGQHLTYDQLMAPSGSRSASYPHVSSRCRFRIADGVINVLEYSAVDFRRGRVVVEATDVPDDWARAARRAGTVVLLALAGGTLTPDTPVAGIWNDPRLRAALAGPKPHMMPLPDVANGNLPFDLSELDIPADPDAVIPDLTYCPVATRSRVMQLQIIPPGWPDA